MYELTIIDFVFVFILMFLGAWKAKELVDVYAPKTADWIIKKIKGRK